MRKTTEKKQKKAAPVAQPPGTDLSKHNLNFWETEPKNDVEAARLNLLSIFSPNELPGRLNALNRLFRAFAVPNTPTFMGLDPDDQEDLSELALVIMMLEGIEESYQLTPLKLTA